MKNQIRGTQCPKEIKMEIYEDKIQNMTNVSVLKFMPESFVINVACVWRQHIR